MQKYDVALKTLLQASGVSILHQLAGVHLARWINTELPQMKAPRLDLLGETEGANWFISSCKAPMI